MTGYERAYYTHIQQIAKELKLLREAMEKLVNMQELHK